MAKMNEFYDAYPNALEGYNRIVNELVFVSAHNSLLETDIEFEDIPNHTFTLRCYNGVAVGSSEDKTINIVVEYPRKCDLTHEQRTQCEKYRNKLYVHFGDIMVKLGKILLVHHKK